MVLWEITLATAYILGLKRTYRLSLQLQRRLVPPNRPTIRQFLHRVHRNIQQRDIEVGRNLGSWILRHLDKMRPSAQIRGPQLPTNFPSKMNILKRVTNSLPKKPGTIQTSQTKDSSRYLRAASRNMWSKSFLAISVMMQQQRQKWRFTQCRDFCIRAPEMTSSGFIGRARGSEGVLRKDIMQYLGLNGQ